MTDNVALRVLTYNLGDLEVDFAKVCPRYGIDPESERIVEIYSAAERVGAAALLEQNVDVLLLQEVIKADRVFIEIFQNRGFQLYHVPDLGQYWGFSAILLNPARFENITNYSREIEGKSTTIVAATDAITRRRILFVAMHVYGLPLEQVPVSQENAHFGDEYIKRVIQFIDQIGDSRVQVIGADMNANPERLAEGQPDDGASLLETRFTLLEGAGFEIFRTRQMTQLNLKCFNSADDNPYPERELDFLFVRETPPPRSIMQRVCFTSPHPVIEEAEVIPEVLLSFDRNENDELQHASDHLPVLAEFQVRRANSLRERFLSALRNFIAAFAARVRGFA